MTAPVAPMEARCELCHDTGSLSQLIEGDLDCHYCDATEKRRKLRKHLVESRNYGFPDADSTAWAAYLFAQRQAAPVAPQPEESTRKIMAWLSADGTEAKTAETKAWMEARDYGVWAEVAKRYVTPLYAEPQPSDKAASFWSEAEARNHEVRPAQLSESEKNAATSRMLDKLASLPAQQVEAVGQVPVAYDVMYDGESAGNIFKTLERAQEHKSYMERVYHTPRPIRSLYAVPQLEAQQAGDVARLPEKMTPEMREAMWEGITRHGLANLEYWIEDLYNDIRAAAVAQGRKA